MRFEREHGHCNVPQKYARNPSLGAWVAQQRRRYKHGTLSDKRILLMEQAGVEWSLRRGHTPPPPRAPQLVRFRAASPPPVAAHGVVESCLSWVKL